jgi:hypothetical protein
MPIINFECKRCKQEFSCDVGEITFPQDMLPGKRPTFEKEIICNKCGKRTMDEVWLSELGQTQLTQLQLREMQGSNWLRKILRVHD